MSGNGANVGYEWEILSFQIVKTAWIHFFKRLVIYCIDVVDGFSKIWTHAVQEGFRVVFSCAQRIRSGNS